MLPQSMRERLVLEGYLFMEAKMLPQSMRERLVLEG